MTKGEELVALLRSIAGQWYYTNDWWARMNPEESGGSDCSGTARWAYSKFGYDIGTWTGDESHAGYEIARGHYPSEIPWDIMKPGDLILMTATYWNNYEFDEYLCHVEIYCGGGTMIGHPGGYGPQEKWAQAWMEAYKCITWMVRRVFEEGDDMEAHDVWEYNYKSTAPKGNMYNCMLDIHKNAQPHSIWEYDYNGTAPGGNMYNCVINMSKKVDELSKVVNKLQAGGASVDYDKLAKALAPVVADELSARLKA